MLAIENNMQMHQFPGPSYNMEKIIEFPVWILCASSLSFTRDHDTTET